jgi:hypothetical protein
VKHIHEAAIALRYALGQAIGQPVTKTNEKILTEICQMLKEFKGGKT